MDATLFNLQVFDLVLNAAMTAFEDLARSAPVKQEKPLEAAKVSN